MIFEWGIAGNCKRIKGIVMIIEIPDIDKKNNNNTNRMSVCAWVCTSCTNTLLPALKISFQIALNLFYEQILWFYQFEKR